MVYIYIYRSINYTLKLAQKNKIIMYDVAQEFRCLYASTKLALKVNTVFRIFKAHDCCLLLLVKPIFVKI